MKKVILSMVVCFVVSGCSLVDIANVEHYGLYGSWRYEDATKGDMVLTFNRNMTYEVDSNGDGQKDIWGAFHFTRDWVYLLDKGGDYGDECRQGGVYEYERSNLRVGRHLNFTLIGDQCDPRKVVMEETFVTAPMSYWMK